MLIHNKDDIEFVTEFPCFLGHPVYNLDNRKVKWVKNVIKYELTNKQVVTDLNEIIV